MTGDDFGRDLAFVHGFMRQHGLANDVANGKYVRHVGAHLLVDRDETLFVGGNAGGFHIEGTTIGTAADGD